MSDFLPFAPAAARNAAAILPVLGEYLPGAGRVLELGAGTGQHAETFARAFPALDWLPTDLTPALAGLRARQERSGLKNLQPPQVLDVLATHEWPRGPFAAAYSANTAHIMPWVAVQAMFAGLRRSLEGAAPFMLYGPFQRNGRHTAPSNARFHEALRAQDPQQGVRDLAALETEAQRHQMILSELVPMPANNFVVIFRHEQ